MTGNKTVHRFSLLPWWQQVFIIAGVSTALILLSGYLGVYMAEHFLDWGGSERPHRSLGNGLASWFVRWDALYYLKIATIGYSPDGIERAFFPGYPLLCNALSGLLNIPILWSGLIISIGSFAGAGLFLYKLVLYDSDRPTAFYSVLWICFSPVSFFFVSFYPESLFLMLAIGSIYFERQGSFFLSGVLIFFAGSTTPLATLLAIPYFVEYFHHKPQSRKEKVMVLLGMLIAPLGFFAYMGYLGWQAGTLNGLNVYVALQSLEWDRMSMFPWSTFFHGIQSAVTGKNVSPLLFSRLLTIQNLGFALIGISMAVWSWFHLRRSYAIYLAGGMLFLLINHGPAGNPLMSFPRHLALFFPVYMVLAVLSGKMKYTLRISLIILSILILVIYSAWFASGRWVA
ncbi:MAG: hypothetical protein K9N36_08910 [Candidatus Marinimicrobia bacterium]|nr:hypothetical protein [Candidatus Neomarinimicrobiota bacterium]